MKHNNLLKDAIADAETIKNLAIETARASLNETFDSKVKSIVAAKLQEEAGDDDLENLENFEADEAKKAPEFGSEEDEDQEDKEKEDSDESFDIDAILAEMDADDEEDEFSTDEAKGKKVEDEEPKEEDEEDSEPKEEEEVDETIDVDALLAEMIGESDDEDKDDEPKEDEEGAEDEKVDEEMMDYAWIPAALAALGVAGTVAKDVVSIMKSKGLSFADAVKEVGKGLRGSIDKSKNVGESDAQELQEIKRQAKVLAKKVNETNLINAKLLYLNKVLRNHNLSEQQKVKVVSAFDKASSVKEAKIVFESLNEALNLRTDKTKTNLKESFGFASKATGVSTKREIISEADTDSQKARWQKLAGIIK
jgi:hypothetical protein